MHVAEGDIILYLEGRLEGAEKERVESHVADCDVCASQLAAISRMDDVMTGEGHLIDSATRGKAERFVLSGVSDRSGLFDLFLKNPFRIALTGGLAVVALILLYVNVSKDPVSQFRSPAPALPIEIVSPEDGRNVSTRDLSFSWHSIPNSSEYRFLLYDARGVTLWKKELADTTLDLPHSVVLEPGMSYLWRVETLFPNGEQTRSKLNAFTYLSSQ